MLLTNKFNVSQDNLERNVHFKEVVGASWGELLRTIDELQHNFHSDETKNRIKREFFFVYVENVGHRN